MLSAEIIHADCLDILATMEAGSVCSVVTDPPAGIAFMGREWDRDKGGRDAWVAWMRGIAEECLRVAKPGAHALVWALPRTSHWTATAWEDAGWDVRDRVAHLHGQGFPKSLNLDGEWEGWGTALKPAMEDWWLLRKPFPGTVAQNVAAHGTGALNVDACRIPTAPGDYEHAPFSGPETGRNAVGSFAKNVIPPPHPAGRWPANVCHDGSPEVLDAFARFGEKQGGRRGVGRGTATVNALGGSLNSPRSEPMYGDTGTAARFFYCAKASRSERNAGLDGFDERSMKLPGKATGFNPATGEVTDGYTGRRRNTHPTVKPLALMRWLVRLVTPPGGLVLDPFAGSGTTGLACLHEGFRFVGIEREEEYVTIARARLAAFVPEPQQLDAFAAAEAA